jgi:ankyrin repeat protein
MVGILLAAASAGAGCTAFFERPLTPLAVAAWQGDVAAIRTLARTGASVNAADEMGTTPLYWAARGGHALGPHRCTGEEASRPSVVTALLELGANPNVQDLRPRGLGRSSGWTPLFVAIHHEQWKAAAALLDHGADPNIRSDQGLSVMEMASSEGAPRELIELIVAKGFDPRLARQRP